MPCIQNIRVKCYMKKINVNINQKITEYIYIYIYAPLISSPKKKENTSIILIWTCYIHILVLDTSAMNKPP